MKLIMTTFITLASCYAFAIEFITEEDVQATLNADKVIAISKYTVAGKLAEEGSSCSEATKSKSARAYVVKKDHKSFVYVTTSGLAELQLCGEI